MRYLLAAIGGAAVGAGAALLLAPQNGKATRTLLKDKVTKCTHDTQDLIQGKATHLKNKMQGMKHGADGLMQRGQEMMDQGKAALGMDASTGQPTDTAPA